MYQMACVVGLWHSQYNEELVLIRKFILAADDKNVSNLSYSKAQDAKHTSYASILRQVGGLKNSV